MRRSIVFVVVILLGSLPVCGCHNTTGFMDLNECCGVCCLDKCKQQSLYHPKAAALERIALAYADLGLYDPAFQAIERVDHGYSKAMALAKIAKKLEKTGDRNRSAKTSHQAFQEARAIKYPYPKANALLKLCKAKGVDEAERMDMLSIAAEEAESIKNVTRKNIILVEIVEMASVRKQFDEALRTADSIEVPCFKAKALAKVAEEYTATGERDRSFDLLSRAVDLVELDEDPVSKSWTLKNIADAYQKIGQYEQALEIAQLIQEKSPKGAVLRDIARSYVERGECGQAKDVVYTIEDPSTRAKALADMAGALTDAGRMHEADECLEQALQAADAADIEIRRNWAIKRIVDVYSKTGRYDQAIWLIGSVNSAFYRATMMADVACSMVKADRDEHVEELLSQAVEIIETIEKPSSKAFALADIARTYYRVGHKDKAVVLLDQALEVAESIDVESGPVFLDV